MAFEKGPQNKETDTGDIFKLSKLFSNCRQPSHIHSVFRKNKFDCIADYKHSPEKNNFQA